MDFDVIGFGEARDPKRTLLKPEEALMLAVFQVGCKDINDRSPIVRSQANAWFETNQDGGVYSFVNICHYFKLNPEATRKALRHFYETDEPKKSRARTQTPSEERPEFLSLAEEIDFENSEFADIAGAN